MGIPTRPGWRRIGDDCPKNLSKNLGALEHDRDAGKLEQRQMGLALLLEAHQQLAKAIYP